MQTSSTLVSCCWNRNVTNFFCSTLLHQEYFLIPKHTLQKHITKVKPLPLSTFVLKLNFIHVHVSDSPKLLRIYPYEIFDRISDVTYEIFILTETIQYLNTHKNHFDILVSVIFFRSK